MNHEIVMDTGQRDFTGAWIRDWIQRLPSEGGRGPDHGPDHAQASGSFFFSTVAQFGSVVHDSPQIRIQRPSRPLKKQLHKSVTGSQRLKESGLTQDALPHFRCQRVVPLLKILQSMRHLGNPSAVRSS